MEIAYANRCLKRPLPPEGPSIPIRHAYTIVGTVAQDPPSSYLEVVVKELPVEADVMSSASLLPLTEPVLHLSLQPL